MIKRLMHPLIASALITIVPFLLTFEKGQDIVRGLFGYEYFALLLFIVYIKNKFNKEMSVYAGTTGMPLREILQKPKHTLVKITAEAFLLILLITALFSVAWIDLQNLLAIKSYTTGWYGILPFATCGIAIVIVWQTKPLNFKTICTVLFFTLFLHLGLNNLYAVQPLAQFSSIDYLDRLVPAPVQRNNVSEEYHNKYIVTDSASITRNFIDSNRTNAIILVESWGVPLDIQRFEQQLEVFHKLITSVGIHHRMYSRTRTAEREDLIYKIRRDSIGRRDTTFLPKVLSEKNYKTTFLFGGDNQEQGRFKYIYNLGFQNIYFANDASDAKIINLLDNLLNDSTQQFIVWTTRDTKFPLKGLSFNYKADANAVDYIYSDRLESTLQRIANLAQKHSNVRFIIQGDHNPILSPITFQERFFKRWVPFIVLN